MPLLGWIWKTYSTCGKKGSDGYFHITQKLEGGKNKCKIQLMPHNPSITFRQLMLQEIEKGDKCAMQEEWDWYQRLLPACCSERVLHIKETSGQRAAGWSGGSPCVVRLLSRRFFSTEYRAAVYINIFICNTFLEILCFEWIFLSKVKLPKSERLGICKTAFGFPRLQFGQGQVFVN